MDLNMTTTQFQFGHAAEIILSNSKAASVIVPISDGRFAVAGTLDDILRLIKLQVVGVET